MSKVNDKKEKKEADKSSQKVLGRVIVRKGLVVSDKMDKTAVVEISVFKSDPKYRKSYKDSSRYKIHDENNDCKKGDVVTFIQCRPVSRRKKWKLQEVVEKARS